MTSQSIIERSAELAGKGPAMIAASGSMTIPVDFTVGEEDLDRDAALAGTPASWMGSPVRSGLPAASPHSPRSRSSCARALDHLNRPDT
ncbi:hypothetical protein RHA1_ro10330 (plasmid) [Rhodococcus jostii RHA1]|jgi:hypothetical protein|uniref:Uncharacterized protein n=1 Tax=Rhodococcus jostii (strain RHA1) TaxID=101510 RepID=Q0RW17_RHOJR|nr:hypothetical protein RHA1_ro10330 [Rhodococcus jostii RHA1]